MLLPNDRPFQSPDAPSYPIANPIANVDGTTDTTPNGTPHANPFPRTDRWSHHVHADRRSHYFGRPIFDGIADIPCRGVGGRGVVQ